MSFSEDEPREAAGGITAPFRRLLEATTGFLSSKVELISIEWQEEKRRLLEALILAGVALVFGVLAFGLITFCVVAFFWETHRFLALLGLGALYLGIAGGLLVRLQRKVHLSTKVFEATVEELKKDTAWVKRHL